MLRGIVLQFPSKFKKDARLKKSMISGKYSVLRENRKQTGRVSRERTTLENRDERYKSGGRLREGQRRKTEEGAEKGAIIRRN